MGLDSSIVGCTVPISVNAVCASRSISLTSCAVMRLSRARRAFGGWEESAWVVDPHKRYASLIGVVEGAQNERRFEGLETTRESANTATGPRVPTASSVTERYHAQGGLVAFPP